MLSLEERIEILKEELANTTPEELLEELQQYEPIGILACDFLEDLEETEKDS